MDISTQKLRFSDIVSNPHLLHLGEDGRLISLSQFREDGIEQEPVAILLTDEDVSTVKEVIKELNLLTNGDSRQEEGLTHVWVGTMREGDSVWQWAAVSHGRLLHKVAKWCRQYWNDLGYEEPEEEGDDSNAPPDDDGAAIEMYVDRMNQLHDSSIPYCHFEDSKEELK